MKLKCADCGLELAVLDGIVLVGYVYHEDCYNRHHKKEIIPPPIEETLERLNQFLE